ncbi:C50 carotenoid epsilon cyclase, partial [Patescibacteria group bacterium]|nr:C50 carotenoid epsilon cyclase [Patescibacteria group bacterium]
MKQRTENLRKANKQLKNLDKVKSEFISIASHQLRTPLTVIKGYLSMILEGDFGKVEPKQQDPLNKVYLSG